MWGLVSALLLVNLNTASLEELDRLPGIGPVIAARIIEFREKRNGFQRVEELLAIQGISERMWRDLKDLVTVRDPEKDSEPAGERAPDTFDGPTQKEAGR